MARPKTDTAKRIVDIAEKCFAERGFDASSMGEIAKAVGIRTPSLYSHFDSKQALYEAVIDSRLEPLFGLLESVNVLPETAEGSLTLLRTVMAHYIEHPTLARLIQHAALAGGQQLETLQERCYRPLAVLFRDHLDDGHLLPDDWNADKFKLLIINFHSMIFGYINMAPLYAELMGEDLMAPTIAEQQLLVLEDIARQLWRS
ncbi:TetR/AcrR family transcriptional regulator [Deltaproteobacteria bacterium]|nr:TetR/AcrR family transcriptional regulator [Deltaproteobacteria bacterium]